MRPTRSRPRAVARGLSVAIAIVVAAVALPTVGLAAAAPGLGTADNYALVANTTITNTGVTLIDGNLALVGPSVTGFGPGVITGRTDIGNAAATKAEADVLTAHHAATDAAPVIETAGDLGGKTLTPGVYHIGAGATLGAGETLTLDGQGQTNPVFIFQIGSTLITGTAAHVRLTNGASGCAVFWAVGSSATIGTATSLQGNLMALVSITMNTGASIGVGGGRNGGRAFAQNGAITLDTNTIIAPTGNCVTPAATPEPTPTPTLTPTVKPTSNPSSAPTPGLTSLPPVATPPGTKPTPTASSPGASSPASSGPVAPSPAVGAAPVSSRQPPASGPPAGFVIPTGVDGTVTFDGGAIGFIGPFVVPGFLAGASGFLIILLMLGQALGALAWLPIVRRRVGSFGIGRPN